MPSWALAFLVSIAAALPAQTPAVPLGATVDAPFVDLRWQTRRLAELGAAQATVLFFATIECPLVQRYLPRLGRLARDLEPRGVVVLVVNVGPGDAFVDAIGQVAEIAPAATFGKDFTGMLAAACGVDRTATAIVLDASGHLVYRGRVDDQYGYVGARPEPSRDDLRLAVEDVLAGRQVAVPVTEVQGCRITRPQMQAPSRAPTYHGDVAKILHRHCIDCHRPGGEAPFPLLDEAAARRHAAMLGEVVAQQRMPPWYGSSRYGAFTNHRGLSAQERDVLLAWVEAGAPSGDAADAPPPPRLPEGDWRIGEPDLVLTLKSDVRLPADGIVPYRYFVLPHRFAQDTWIEAIEIRPDNKRVLHHCNLARVRLGEPFSHDGFITGYVPGGDAMVLDPGTAVRIPAGSALALQAHYVTTGTPEVDRLRVGLRFPRVPVQKELRVAIAANTRFSIPPGARAHPVRASRRIDEAAIGIGMFVHMHLRGRDMLIAAEAPDGSSETLLLVPNYNFDWQQSYRWAPGAREFAPGTRIRALAHFDNSAWNPFNPDPTTTVHFGLETTDEMMYAFLFWVARDQALDLAIDPATGHAVQ